MRRVFAVTSLILAGFGIAASSALAAMPDCAGPVFQKTIYSDQGVLESVVAGGKGKLFVSGTDGSSDSALLRRYGKPGAGPKVISTAGAGPGGLAWAGKRLLWGNGNTQAKGSVGDVNPTASLFSVLPSTGGRKTISKSLGMANGIARARNGAIFASNALGEKLDRISPAGATQHGWASVHTANGLAVSPNGKYLFANQTLAVPSAIARIEIADPSNVTTWFTAEAPGVGGLDGLTVDEDGNLYAAAWLAGQIWKITPDHEACILASGITQPSNVAFGKGRTGFSKGMLYAVSFGGEIVQIKGARRATVPAA
jgi:hypothetical protein